MGKRLRKQRKGTGTSRFRVPPRKRKESIKYEDFSRPKKAQIIDFIHDPKRSAPIAKIKYDNKIKYYLPPEGLRVGDFIELGTNEPEKGNILPLKDIPEGVEIFNIEIRPKDGGKLVKSSGTSARITARGKKEVSVILPSKSVKRFNPNCRATVGKVAGGGRKERPFKKAGAKYHAVKAKGKYWPVTKAVAMNPVDHPFGGSTKPGRPKSTSRDAPPGRKVGSISSKRTGKRKRK